MALEVPGGRSTPEAVNYRRPRGRLPLAAAHSAVGAALAKEVRQPGTDLLCERAISDPVTSGVPSHRGSAPGTLSKPPQGWEGKPLAWARPSWVLSFGTVSSCPLPNARPSCHPESGSGETLMRKAARPTAFPLARTCCVTLDRSHPASASGSASVKWGQFSLEALLAQILYNLGFQA